ncbi:MAG: hypothetical protein ONB46_01395 [candidate division KSB1 bacterium]|nr:hypothetical protein [candidate division KSB1 bacterium]MDZ7364320.1 hypothetical protein [candidate division KSB1 bacterium]
MNTNRSKELQLFAAAAVQGEFYASLAEIADLSELRTQMKTLPSHWWWHLDKLAQQKRETVAV